ncbi:hypothetical protein RIF29_36350 [Crotalaria pallida]|uniref:Cyanobacterial aminoacyl-tRNA synthetase CAAD domain-containing protein n=1 Tax=Crotalaria pallida TaxID=3830 RepID=A0AAN9EAZ9_CROPI
MGLCTVQPPITLSKPPNASSSLLLLPNPNNSSSIPRTHTPPLRTAALLSRSICLRNVLSKASTSEETSSGTTSQVFDEKVDDDDVEAVGNVFNKTDPKQELPLEEQDGLSLDVLDNINLKLGLDDTGSVALFGSGALVALWLASAVISAIDSIPLFPKLLEVVGLGYTVWFTSRYLLFKKNRDELVAKIEELKEQVLGSEDK